MSSSNSTSSSSWKPWPVETVLRSLTRNLNLATSASHSNNNNNHHGINNGSNYHSGNRQSTWSSFLLPRQWPSPSVMASGIGVNISLLSQHQGRATAAAAATPSQPVKTLGNNNNGSKRRSSSTSFGSCLSTADNINYHQQVWPSFERTTTHHSSSSSSCSSSSYSKL